jgi:hypothetical protein
MHAQRLLAIVILIFPQVVPAAAEKAVPSDQVTVTMLKMTLTMMVMTAIVMMVMMMR